MLNQQALMVDIRLKGADDAIRQVVWRQSMSEVKDISHQ
jgi:hypothetical protein